MPGKGFDQNYLDAQSNAEKQEGKRFTSTLKDDDFDAFKHYLQELKKSNSNATISYETDANDGIGAPAWKPQTISIDDFLSGLDSGGSASLPKFRFLPYINSTDVQSVYLFDQIFDALKANDHKKVDALLDSEMNGVIDQKDLDEYRQEMAAAYRIYNHDMDQEITRIGSVLEGIVLQSGTSSDLVDTTATPPATGLGQPLYEAGVNKATIGVDGVGNSNPINEDVEIDDDITTQANNTIAVSSPTGFSAAATYDTKDDYVFENIQDQDNLKDDYNIDMGRLPKRDRQAIRWILNEKDGVDLYDEDKIDSINGQSFRKIAKKVLLKTDYVSLISLLPTQITNGSKNYEQNRENFAQGIVEQFNALKTKGSNKWFIDDFARFYYDYLHKKTQSGTNQLMEAVRLMGLTGTDVQTGYKMEKAVDKVEQGDTGPQTLRKLFGLLADRNLDGSVDNKGDRGVLMGTQISDTYDEVSRRLMFTHKIDANQAAQRITTNMVTSLYDALRTHKDYSALLTPFQKAFFKNPPSGKVSDQLIPIPSQCTPENFLRYVQNNATTMKVFRVMMDTHADELEAIFSHGVGGAQRQVDRWNDVVSATEVQSDVLNDGEAALDAQSNIINKQREDLPEQFKERVSQKVEPAYDAYLAKLRSGLNAYEAGTSEKPDGLEKSERELIQKTGTSPELKNSLQSLLDGENREENLKTLKISAVGLGVSAIEGHEGIGTGFNLTSPKFNKHLQDGTNGWVDAMNLSLGAGLTSNGVVALGMGLGFSGEKELGKNGNRSIIHAVGAGAGMANGRIMAGPYANVGLQRVLNAKSFEKKLNGQAEHSVGLMGHFSLWANGVSIYHTVDHAKGIERQADQIQHHLEDNVFKNIIGQGLQSEEEIMKLLEGKFEKTDREKLVIIAKDIAQAVAPYVRAQGATTFTQQKIATILARNYANAWKAKAFEDISDDGLKYSGMSVGAMFVAGFLPLPTLGIKFTDYRTKYGENDESLQDAQQVLAEGLGAELVRDETMLSLVEDGRMNMLFRLEGVDGFQYNKEKNQVAIPQALLAKSKLHILPELKQFVKSEGNYLIVPGDMVMTVSHLQRGAGVDKTEYHMILGHVGLDRRERADGSYDGDNNTAIDNVQEITEDAFGSFVGSPESYVDHQNAERHTLSVAGLEKGLFDLIVGLKKEDITSISMDDMIIDLSRAETQADGSVRVPMVDTQNNPAVDANGNPKYKVIPATGVLKFDQKDDKLFVKHEAGEQPLQLTYTSSFDFQKYLEEATDFHLQETKDFNTPELIDKFMSVKGDLSNNKAFMNMAEDRPIDEETGKPDIDAMRAAMPASVIQKLGIQRDQLSSADISNLFANTSRTHGTKYKQLDLADQESLIDRLGDSLSQENRDTLKAIAKKGSLDTDDIASIKSILGVDLSGYGSYDDLKGKSTDDATNVYYQRTKIGADKYDLAWMLADMKMVTQARTASYRARIIKESGLSGHVNDVMHWRATAMQKLDGSQCDVKDYTTAIGSVARYEGTGVDEKYVVAPRLACEPVDMMDMQFDEHATGPTYVAMRKYFLEQFAAQSKGIMKTLVDGLNEAYKGNITIESFKKQLTDTGSVKIGDKTLTPKFLFGRYAHCINETFMLDFEGESGTKTVPAGVETGTVKSGGIFLNEYTVANEAQVDQTAYGIGGIAGSRIKQSNIEGNDGTGNSNPGSNNESDNNGSGNGGSNTGGNGTGDSNGTGNGQGG